MATFKWKSLAMVSLPLLFFILFNCSLTATSTQFMSDQVDMCNIINCVQGTCEPTQEFPGFKCNCNPGWVKVKVFEWEMPTLCLLPNCTVDFKCGNGSPAPPPPALPFQLPNLTDPCSLAMCGDGTCERNGNEYNCKCNEGSSNLLSNPKLACLKKCSLRGDCHGINFGASSPPPPPQNSAGSGPGTPSSSSEKLYVLSSITALATAFLALII